MNTVEKAIDFLDVEIGKKETGSTLSFEDYLDIVRQDPKATLRSIFQLFHDMVKSYVGEGIDEYPNDPESIGFVKYDMSKLLVEGADNPYLADRLFANRFMRQVGSLRQGFQQNRVYAYIGPSGCGKSTFMNNLLRSFENYTNSKEGRMFELVWEIDESLFIPDSETHETFTISCPSHDHPILIIPKEYRVKLLSKLLLDEMEHFKEKQYDWLFRGEVCAICKSLFGAAFEKLGSMQKVRGLIRARPYRFDRKIGEGISVFNPGDKPIFGMSGDLRPSPYFTNKQLQEKLIKTFGPSTVRYLYSYLAKTNNGVYVLMDVKMNNQDRLTELHNVISEGVHKVGDTEEQINSLFFALMNPEDQELLKEKKMESLQGRIHFSSIPFILEPSTEVNIYLNNFGESIRKHFLPRILENFARVIVSSRIGENSPTLKDWIPNMDKYASFCDKYGRLLRMEIYGGVIPGWLSEEDRKKFDAARRRDLISEGEHEGEKGFSGRQSIRLFNDFFNRYSAKAGLINMDNVTEFFKEHIGKEMRDNYLPQKGFLDSLVKSYNYTVLTQVKESLYFYNPQQIEEDVLHYIWAVSKNPGSKTVCPFTEKEMEVTIGFLELMATRISGKEKSDAAALEYAMGIQKKVAALVQNESNIRKTIRQSKLYIELFDDYARNLKEKVLQPFANNQNFKDAIRFFGTKEFEAFDARLKEHVSHMMKNLQEKFGYTEQGAKEIVLYVLEHKLHEEFK